MTVTGYITAGADGIVQTVPNSGNYYPGTDLAGVVAALDQGYASGDGDQIAYIDFAVSNGKQDMDYEFGWNTLDELNTYLKTQLHPSSQTHKDNTYLLSGLRNTIVGSSGYSGDEPHALVAVGSVLTTRVPTDVNGFDATAWLAQHIIHEFGHVLLPSTIGGKITARDIHDNHSEIYQCVGFDAPFSDFIHLFWCPHHVRLLRDNITRSFGNHPSTGSGIQGESGRDSD